MKVLGITGSPRDKSNTEFFVRYTLEKIEEQGLEAELLRIRDKKIGPCVGCYGCVKEKRCVIDDDFEDTLLKIQEADGILLGSPVYHGAITPQLKALLDRAGFSSRWRVNKMEDTDKNYRFTGTLFSGKVGAPITVARRAGMNSAFSELLLWFTVNDFIVIGSHYWNIGLAGKGGVIDAEKDEEGLNNLAHLAQNMALVIKKLKSNGGTL